VKTFATTVKRSILSEREAYWQQLTSAELFDKFGIDLSDEVEHSDEAYDLLIYFSDHDAGFYELAFANIKLPIVEAQNREELSKQLIDLIRRDIIPGGNHKWRDLAIEMDDSIKGNKYEFIDGAEFKRLRKLMGFTHTTLAAMMGISRQQISNYENGRIRIPYLKRINMFNWTKQFLFPDSDFQEFFERLRELYATLRQSHDPVEQKFEDALDKLKSNLDWASDKLGM
jgi:transcriptional regulator with XRE-family HTH domain